MRVRVGLIGLGDAWQRGHGPALRALADRLEVRAVFEQVGHRARQAACEFGARAVDGYQTLVRREDIDAVLILSAQWYGPLPVLAACEFGKAVYCCAGLDLELEQARLVKRRVEETGIAFMAEFPYRRSPATLRLKELIATRLGPPRLLFCHQRQGAHTQTKQTAESSCQRMVLDELVDWCRYVAAEEPTWVMGLAHTRCGCASEEDYEMLSLGFSDRRQPGSGPVAQISCGRYIPTEWREAITYRSLAGLQVSCENGIAFVDLPSTLVWFDDAGRHQESLDGDRPFYEQLLAQFHRAVANPIHKTRDMEDVYLALSIVRQARRSYREGRRIEL